MHQRRHAVVVALSLPLSMLLLLLLLLQDAGTKSDFFLDVQAFKQMKE
jgi:hypothetical protein